MTEEEKMQKKVPFSRKLTACFKPVRNLLAAEL